MRVFAVRGVDGQLGIVAARNRVDAVERLDEFANFEGCPIRELTELMLLLDIDDDGRFVLEQVGEEMNLAIRTFAYPLVEKAFESLLVQQEAGQLDPTGITEQSPNPVQEAVTAERHRVRRKRVAEPVTEPGRDAKLQTDLPSSLIRKYEQLAARAVLKRQHVPKDPRKRH